MRKYTTKTCRIYKNFGIYRIKKGFYKVTHIFQDGRFDFSNNAHIAYTGTLREAREIIDMIELENKEFDEV